MEIAFKTWNWTTDKSLKIHEIKRGKKFKYERNEEWNKNDLRESDKYWG